jgi:hypothetical protein
MKALSQSLITTLLLLLGILCSRAQGTLFTYQGRLTTGGVDANGWYDLTFTVFDRSYGGSQLANTVTNTDTIVSNGLFTVFLDFGVGVFTGPARWLEIGVRTNASAAAYKILSPRQLLTPAPYAITAVNVSGVISSGSLAGTYANKVAFTNPTNSFQGAFNGNGGALTNVNAVTLNGMASSNFVAAKNGVLLTNLSVIPVGAQPATNPRAVFTNDYVCNELWLTSDGNVDRSSLLFGRLFRTGNGANILWNPVHDDPNGTFGGEMQITAPQIAFGMGSDSSPGFYHPGRRMQLGIGGGHLQWIDVHFDDNSPTNNYPGWTVPLRWQIEQGTLGSHTAYPAILGYSEDLVGGTGHASLGFYDYFDTTPMNQGSYWTFAGAASTMRGRMKTGRGWDFYGAIGITNIVSPADGSTLFNWDGTFVTLPQATVIRGNVLTLQRPSDSAAFATFQPGLIQLNSGQNGNVLFESGNGLGGFLYAQLGADGNYIQPSLAINASGNAPATHGILDVNGVAWASDGFASARQNGSAPVAITFPSSGVSWTNPLSVNIQVYIDNAGATGTAINKNGTKIFSTLSPDVTINLQPGETFSETYTAGVPSAKYSPF